MSIAVQNQPEFMRPYLEKRKKITKWGDAGVVTQGVGPEFTTKKRKEGRKGRDGGREERETGREKRKKEKEYYPVWEIQLKW
jgi:hypothetical protein